MHVCTKLCVHISRTDGMSNSRCCGISSSRVDPKRIRHPSVYSCGCTVVLICIVSTACAVAAIIYGSQANTCLTPSSYSKWRTSDISKEQMKWKSSGPGDKTDSNLQTTTTGWYAAPIGRDGTSVIWQMDNPYNCLTECQMNCTAAFAEQKLLLKRVSEGGCADCLINCTHPWGKHIETCHENGNCIEQHASHQGIVNFCQPVARCFQMCAGRGYPEIDKRARYNNEQDARTWEGILLDKQNYLYYGGNSSRCLKECETDGLNAIAIGMAAMILVWLAPLFIVLGVACGRKHEGTSGNEIRLPLMMVLGFICWVASFVLSIDIFILNTREVFPNMSWKNIQAGLANPGQTVSRISTVGFDYIYYVNLPTYDILGSTPDNPRLRLTFNWMMHLVYFLGLLSNMFTLLAYHDVEEIWNRNTYKKPPPKPQAPKKGPEPMRYYGEERAKEEAEMIKKNPLGIVWGYNVYNNMTEVMVERILPGGSADMANSQGLNGKVVACPAFSRPFPIFP